MGNGSRKNLILAVVTDYDWDKMGVFFLSLEQTGYTGEVTLFIENINQETQEMIKKLNIAVNLIPIQRVGLEYIFAINDYRYYLYYKFMVENESNYKDVLLTDIRDVFFQSDPFKEDWKRDSITVAKECCEISKEIYNTRWILTKFGYHIYNSLQNKTILCSGTTYGPSKQIIKYLKEMNAALFYNGYFSLSDQAVHNYIVYSEKIKPVSFSDNKTGPIMTVALEDENNLVINEKDQILLMNGKVASIVHQYDRKSSLANMISTRYGANFSR
ncbi:hypothetical protein QUF49_09235 [Fictibacillus sp. b24]|uniref:hypothetical protein n=1 Tax=Fictibacillus sp. b24 TaxID=3055863 RepID=UPI0025A22D25|nr:hypothetical protein [Fictibacillus sp. b24]MDM5316175.1 hypothetical protein [Fictibacillus sp. b24]